MQVILVISDLQAIIIKKNHFKKICRTRSQMIHANIVIIHLTNIIMNDNSEFEYKISSTEFEDFSTKIWEFVHILNVLVFELVH